MQASYVQLVLAFYHHSQVPAILSLFAKRLVASSYPPIKRLSYMPISQEGNGAYPALG